MQITIFKTLDERPNDIPPHWIVFNAPRPLLGQHTFEGEFRHGFIYAAINPTDEHARHAFNVNVEQDGWLVEYVTQSAIDAFVLAEIAAGRARADRVVPEHARASYFERYGRRVEDADACWQRLTGGLSNDR